MKTEVTTSNESPNLPRLCFIGPMIGRHSGYVTTQGLILSDKLAAKYSVITASSSTNRYVRLVDIAFTLIRRRRSIDILTLDVFGGPSFVVEDIASFLGRLFHFKTIMVLRGGNLPQFASRFPRWMHRVLSRSAVIVTPSTYLAPVVDRLGLRTRIIPNVIDLQSYPYRRREVLKPRLLWMRSFHAAYNPAMAIRTLAKLKHQVPDATLVIAGQDKGLQQETRKLASSLGVEESVGFVGFLDKAGKLREGSTADIFINTSTTDNMPVALLEACALGLPVVTTNVGGIPDLLKDGETALFVPTNDHEAMAGAIVRLLRDRELAARLSTNGRELALQSSWSEVRKQWEQLFQELTERPNN